MPSKLETRLLSGCGTNRKEPNLYKLLMTRLRLLKERHLPLKSSNKLQIRQPKLPQLRPNSKFNKKPKPIQPNKLRSKLKPKQRLRLKKLPLPLLELLPKKLSLPPLIPTKLPLWPQPLMSFSQMWPK